MPFLRHRLRDSDVWAKVDDAGALVTDRDGRVEIVYNPKPGAKVYRAGAFSGAGSPTAISTGAPLGGDRLRAPARYTFAPGCGVLTISTRPSRSATSAPASSTFAQTSESRRRWRRNGIAIYSYHPGLIVDPRWSPCYKPRRVRFRGRIEENAHGSLSQYLARRRRRNWTRWCSVQE